MISNLECFEENTTRQHSPGELHINKKLLVMTDEIFFHQTKTLYNLVL